MPFPLLPERHILVRNHYSVISAGTEGKTVSDARKGYLAKAAARKDEVKKVLKAARSHGFADTYKMVMNKLEAPSALGYSCAGEVMAVGEGVTEFKVGDRVACGGAAAVHAEVVSVPVNLAVAVPPEVGLEEAAFTTIAAIAIQGVRRAGLQFGENCVVIGLGLVGQLTLRILAAAGVRCFGIDVDPAQTDFALQHGCEKALTRSDENLESEISRFSRGAGTDAVIITAATASLDPVELAGRIARQKAKVVIVGSVPTGFSRKNYYRKELDLLMSTSYGPGRYDDQYEQKSLDYPIGYVRWTENRNMQSFVDLLNGGRLSMEGIASHRFAFEEAKQAYDLILSRTEQVRGVVLKYNLSKELKKQVTFKTAVAGEAKSVSFIGAGSFASNFLLPNLKGKINLYGVLTARPNSALHIANKFGFQVGTASLDELLAHSEAVFISTRHDSHATYTIKALEAGKRVYVEKPLCLTRIELEKIVQTQSGSNGDFMIGFNRRFSPFVEQIHSQLGSGPCAINYRINAALLPAGHWVHDPQVGGGRVLGEMCHFIDLCSFIAKSPIESVSAFATGEQNDIVTASLQMENGSVASVSYFSFGISDMPKEQVEVFAGDAAYRIDDFKTLHRFGKKSSKTTLAKQDKGHKTEMDLVVKSLQTAAPFPVSMADSVHATLATFAVAESLSQSGARISLKDF